jgi:hypothetical protein
MAEGHDLDESFSQSPVEVCIRSLPLNPQVLARQIDRLVVLHRQIVVVDPVYFQRGAKSTSYGDSEQGAECEASSWLRVDLLVGNADALGGGAEAPVEGFGDALAVVGGEVALQRGFVPELEEGDL